MTKASLDPSLKAQNLWMLIGFVATNVVVFWAVVATGALDVYTWVGLLRGVDLTDGILGLALPAAAIVLSGLISTDGKARIVFLRWTHPLPGSRAFTELGPRDPRVEMASLRTRLGELPTDSDAQNALWYRLSKRHGDKPPVMNAHRWWLLTRDMTALGLLFLLAFGAGVLVTGHGWEVTSSYIGLLLVQMVAVRTSAKNYGDRFVCTVLGEEATAEESDQ